MDKEKETDYAKLLFILIVGIGFMCVFGSILYVSTDSNLWISDYAENPFMVYIWLAYVYLIPIILFIISAFFTAIFMVDTLFPDKDKSDDEN